MTRARVLKPNHAVPSLVAAARYCAGMALSSSFDCNGANKPYYITADEDQD